MKRFIVSATLAAALIPVHAADIGVSISVGEPGFYGRLDIGNFPQPRFIYPQPVIIRPAPVGVVVPPLYLRVPPGHAKHWSKHCHEYGACGQPVYFVEESWYNDVYAPYYRQHRDGRGRDHDKGPGKGNKGRGKGHDKD